MCTVHCAKGVVHIDVAIAGQLLGKFGVVLRLFLMEAQVFQQDDLAVLHVCDRFVRALADDIRREGHFIGEQPLQAARHRREREFRLEFPLRAAEVRAKDDLCVLAEQILDGRERGLDARLVRDFPILQRDIKVYPHKDSFACDIDVTDRFFIHTFILLLYICIKLRCLIVGECCGKYLIFQLLF